MGKLTIATLLALLSGCGTMDAARLDEAVVMVWHGVYGAPSDAAPPLVEVFVGRCVREGDGYCVDGRYIPDRHLVSIGSATSYHESSLAHELYHADEWRRTGDLDADHSGRGWAWYVPDAEAALRDAGL